MVFSRSCIFAKVKVPDNIFQLDDLQLQTLIGIGMPLPEQCIVQKMLIWPYVASL